MTSRSTRYEPAPELRLGSARWRAPAPSWPPDRRTTSPPSSCRGALAPARRQSGTRGDRDRPRGRQAPAGQRDDEGLAGRRVEQLARHRPAVQLCRLRPARRVRAGVALHVDADGHAATAQRDEIVEGHGAGGMTGVAVQRPGEVLRLRGVWSALAGAAQLIGGRTRCRADGEPVDSAEAWPSRRGAAGIDERCAPGRRQGRRGTRPARAPRRSRPRARRWPA